VFGGDRELMKGQRARSQQRDQPLRAEVGREVIQRTVVAGGRERPDDDIAEARGAQHPGELPSDQPVAAAPGLGGRQFGVNHRGVGEQRFRRAPQGAVDLDHRQQTTGTCGRAARSSRVTAPLPAPSSSSGAASAMPRPRRILSSSSNDSSACAASRATSPAKPPAVVSAGS